MSNILPRGLINFLKKTKLSKRIFIRSFQTVFTTPVFVNTTKEQDGFVR